MRNLARLTHQKFFAAFFQKRSPAFSSAQIATRTACLLAVLAIPACAPQQPPLAPSPEAAAAAISVPASKRIVDVSPAEAAMMQAILADPRHADAVLAAQKATTAWARLDCRIASFTPIPGQRVFRFPAVPIPGRPRVFGWVESTRAQGCGVSKQLNAVSIQTGAGNMYVGAIVPGTSKADPILKKDLFTKVGTNERARHCNDFYVADTAVSGDGGSAQSWHEDWTVWGCGQTRVYGMQMTRDATGTGFLVAVPR